MHLEPGVEAALQECHVQELLEPSPHLNEQRMSIYIQRFRGDITGRSFNSPKNLLWTRGWDHNIVEG